MTRGSGQAAQETGRSRLGAGELRALGWALGCGLCVAGPGVSLHSLKVPLPFPLHIIFSGSHSLPWDHDLLALQTSQAPPCFPLQCVWWSSGGVRDSNSSKRRHDGAGLWVSTLWLERGTHHVLSVLVGARKTDARSVTQGPKPSGQSNFHVTGLLASHSLTFLSPSASPRHPIY